jgi:starch synthase (maltosyl-transferring)
MTTGPRIYNLFPSLVGSIDRWTAQLERIAAMGFDWVYVNPFHETGFSGSLYAVKSYYRLNPLFRGDLSGTDDELIGGFVAAAERRGIGVMMDLVVNHTARDADLAREHPAWYRHEADGSIASPWAVDPADTAKRTVWTDLAELDYRERPERPEMIAYFSDLVRHYARLGVRGFRCDAAYKVSGDVWALLVGAAREIRSDALFAAETLGAPVEAVAQLRPAGFDYLFNSSKWWDFRAAWLLDQYEQFRHIAPSIAFPESHDTPRLAAELGDLPAAQIESEYRFRYLFAAFFSSGVMMPIGYEYGLARPLDVVMTRPDHWDQPRFDISAFISEVNAMKAAIPVLNEEGAERAVHLENAAVALVRSAETGSSSAVALVNPEAGADATVSAADVLREIADPRDVTPQAGETTTVVPGGQIVLRPRELRVLIDSLSEPAQRSRNDVESTTGPAPTRGTSARDAIASNRGAVTNGGAATNATSTIGAASNAAPTRPAGSAANGPASGSASAVAVTPTNGRKSTTAAGDPRAAARPIVIEAVWPQIDGGRFAVKRVVGERVEVHADIFREGHDAIAAVLKFREGDAAVWRETPMEPYDNDRWRAAFTVERNTRYRYTIEAWPDAFASWRHGTARKREAGQPIDLELREGEALVKAAVARASVAVRARLEALQRDVAAGTDRSAVADLLLSDATAAALAAAPDRSLATVFAPELDVIADRRAAAFGAWYEFFPRSQGTTPGAASTFAQAQRRLADVRAMGFDVLYLPPIHPIGHAFRKGRNNSLDAGPDDPGSPWAIGNADGGHMAVEPALGTLADFERFVQAANAHGLEIALDYALQCSPDHPYIREHPEWFSVRPDGSIKYAENPPKKYQDIVNFNWFGPHAPALWDELRDVVEFWIAHGVHIFRVDNPHTKPFAFWEWMIGDVQSRHPEVLFLAEAFTRPKVMKELAKCGFTQSYTYFTWRNFKGELIDYCNELAHGEMAEYFRPNFFANTPDILPPFLQTGGRPAFRIRLVLAATLSSVYGIYSGFELCENAALPEREEYADSEKYEIRVRDWDAPGNIKDDVARINQIRRENPALQTWRNLRFLPASHESVLFFAKSAGTNTLFIAVNLDPFRAAVVTLTLPLAELGYRATGVVACDELLTGEHVLWHGAQQTLCLDPQRNPAAIYRIDRRLHVDYDSPSD